MAALWKRLLATKASELVVGKLGQVKVPLFPTRWATSIHKFILGPMCHTDFAFLELALKRLELLGTFFKVELTEQDGLLVPSRESIQLCGWQEMIALCTGLKM